MFFTGVVILMALGHAKRDPPPTFSELIAEDKAILYSTLGVVIVYTLCNLVGWYLLYFSRYKVRAYVILFLEVTQSALLCAVLWTESGDHRLLAISFVCVWYAKTALFPYNAIGWISQAVLVASSASLLVYFAFAPPPVSATYEYGGLLVLSWTTLPPLLREKELVFNSRIGFKLVSV